MLLRIGSVFIYCNAQDDRLAKEVFCIFLQSFAPVVVSTPGRPPREILVASKTPTMSDSLRSFPSDRTDVSAESAADATAQALVLRQVETLERFTMLGSKNYPLIVIANPDKPECGFGFEVTLVPGIPHRGFSRTAYHVRRTTTVTLEDGWTAWIPLKEYQSLAHRAIMFRGPSQDH